MLDTITPSTKLCGILLHPAGHTRSPAMHNAAFRALGIDAVFVAFDVAAQALAGALEGARALPIQQLAISIPHKQAILAHLDDVSEVARRIGAVNTVTWSEGRLRGENTDWTGALAALERETPLDGKRAVVLGAGGAARALVYGLLARGARVTVLNRTPERARALAHELGAERAGALSDLAGTSCEILVNTTSAGLGSDVTPVEAAWIPPESVVMDVVYEPEQTALLRAAAKRGARTIRGKWMLVYQAAEQVRLWTGREAPVEVMAEAFDRAGQHRTGSGS